MAGNERGLEGPTRIDTCPSSSGSGLPPHLSDFWGAFGMRCRDAKRLPDRTVVI